MRARGWRFARRPLRNLARALAAAARRSHKYSCSCTSLPEIPPVRRPCFRHLKRMTPLPLAPKTDFALCIHIPRVRRFRGNARGFLIVAVGEPILAQPFAQERRATPPHALSPRMQRHYPQILVPLNHPRKHAPRDALQSQRHSRAGPPRVACGAQQLEASPPPKPHKAALSQLHQVTLHLLAEPQVDAASERRVEDVPGVGALALALPRAETRQALRAMLRLVGTASSSVPSLGGSSPFPTRFLLMIRCNHDREAPRAWLPGRGVSGVTGPYAAAAAAGAAAASLLSLCVSRHRTLTPATCPPTLLDVLTAIPP
jgi:hypothetical protein